MVIYGRFECQEYEKLKGGGFMKKPVVDRDACTGAAVCVAVAEDVFELDSEGLSTVKDPEGADEETIQQAIDGCPEDAISWEE